MPPETSIQSPAAPGAPGLDKVSAVLPGISHGKTIIFAGCLGMTYTQLTLCPAGIAFARHLGGSGLHIGILGAIPTGMLFLQFLSAVVANHLEFRRGLWMAVSIVQRLVLLPVALGPVLFPNVSPTFWLWGFLGLSAVNHGLLHFATPLWMSWMGDYLPRNQLSRFWGVRHLWMQWAGAASLLFASCLMQSYGQQIQMAFAILIVIAAVPGVADILLFWPVHEPPVTKIAETRIRKVLSEPFRNRDFRSFISFMSFWHFAAMVGAPFISLFLLAEVGMSLSRLLLLWVFCWVGGAACSARIGGLAERFGHRPILILCTLLKSSNMIALILVPNDPETAFLILVPVFILDSILNAGFVVATNGFMLTKSPSGNRTMFIAAGTALAGFVGGVTSVVCGGLLTWFNLDTVVFGVPLSSYRMLFLVSIVLRIASLLLAVRIRESDSHGTRHVVSQLIGATPLRLIHFPVGLFRSETSDRNAETAAATENT
ncbi:MAG: MFS transporter [Rhodopirellula sp.]|nr:MFS transporter [Rhodopirellula sp.]